MEAIMRRASSLLLTSLLSGGCIATTQAQPEPTPAPVTAQVAANGGSTVIGKQGVPGYRVLAGGGAEIPAGDLRYVVTANGQGGYRIAWTDTLGSAAHFQGP